MQWKREEKENIEKALVSFLTSWKVSKAWKVFWTLNKNKHKILFRRLKIEKGKCLTLNFTLNIFSTFALIWFSSLQPSETLPISS